jgi:hypothetical protein
MRAAPTFLFSGARLKFSSIPTHPNPIEVDTILGKFYGVRIFFSLESEQKQ